VGSRSRRGARRAPEQHGQMQTRLAMLLAALSDWRTITYGARASKVANLSGVDQLGHVALRKADTRSGLPDDKANRPGSLERASGHALHIREGHPVASARSQSALALRRVMM